MLKFSRIRKEISGFLDAVLAGLLSFSQLMKKIVLRSRMFVGERRTQFLIKQKIFKKPKNKKYSFLYNNFVPVWVLEILVANLNECKLQDFLYAESCAESLSHPRPINCAENKPNLFTNAFPCSDSSQYAIVFNQSFINAVFLTSGIGSDILINVLEDCIIFLTWAAFFHLSSSISFFWSHSMKKFGMNIQKLNKFIISKDLSFQK